MEIETENSTLSLSPDLLTEIFPKLPVKAVFRFKCVSKSWRSLISHLISSHPKFARLHFELTASHSHKLALFRPDASQIQSIDFNAPLHDPSASSIVNLNFSFLPLQPHEHLRNLGSCHGFILLEYYPNLHLCNPTTGFHKQLPTPLVYSDFLSGDDPFLFGFGYDSATDDYLVAMMTSNTFGNNHMEVFSLKANEWKVWEAPSLPYTSSNYNDYNVGVFFNGALHGIAYHGDRGVNLIVVFDLMERTLSEIALPSDLDCSIDSCELQVLGGFLSLCATAEFGNYAGIIWVMEEYKVQTSWTRLPTVVPLFVYPRCSTESGDIVGIGSTRGGGVDGYVRLVKFNVNGEVLEERPFTAGCTPVMYTESRLSLLGDC